MKPTRLEQAAVEAFASGDRWHQFVDRHRHAIRAAERAQPGTVERLLHLLATGEPGGMQPPDIDEAWGDGQGMLFDVSEPHRG